MTVENEIHVKIGEVKVGRPGDILKATLGSCIGIVMIWKERNIFGLAHCLLPEAPQKTMTIGAKFVSQAVPSLIALLKIKPENLKDVETRIVGGGNMMTQLSTKSIDHVGILNTEAARKYLELYGFTINGADTGGDEGRQIHVNCSSGDMKVLKLQKLSNILD